MNQLSGLKSPILLAGDEKTAYRDPAAIYENGLWHLYYTLVETPAGETRPYLTVAESVGADLAHLSAPKRLTVRDRSLNYSSPGNVIRTPNGNFGLCFQSYCRENGEKYGNARSRIFLMESPDLTHWDKPRLLRVKGDEVAEADMGRMIDPYLIEKDGRWWCFFKQNGVSFSESDDLIHWRFRGSAQAGENVCVVEKDGLYYLFHSPKNGIGIKVSWDLFTWRDTGVVLTFDQQNWPWAKGRITAGFVLDGREIPDVGCYLMFFHGSGPQDESVDFDRNASIAAAWSDDLLHWHWPGGQNAD